MFDKEKVVRTCLRMGASREEAEEIAAGIEKNSYDGIETKKILQMIFRWLSRYKPAVRYQICLRKALSLMKPKPDFERFIQALLREHGYKVVSNQIIQGKCVEHEADAVATKNGKTYLVEVKHHYNYHTPTGLDESRIARAVFEDVTEGAKLGLNTLQIHKPLIVCNTKFSVHAKRYADCRGIRRIGWSSPQNHGLQAMIEEKKMYPIQCLEGLNAETAEKLESAGVFLIKQLAVGNPERLEKKAKTPKKVLELMIRRANAILSQLKGTVSA